MTGTIWLVSGPPGAGKTTVATALCARYPKSMHIPVDDLREWVRAGYASPIDPTAPRTEVREQFLLARQAAAYMARAYAAKDFAVVIDDVIGSFAAEAYGPLLESDARRVLLLPSVDVALARNRTRTGKAFDTSILDPVTRDLHDYFSRRKGAGEGWTVIDSSDLSAEQTVDRMIELCGR